MPALREHPSNPIAPQAIDGRWPDWGLSGGSDARADPSASPFDARDWFDLLHQHCLADHPIHIAAMGDAHAGAILPLMRDGGQLISLSNWYSFHWRPILSGAPDAAARHLVALLQSLKRDTAQLRFTPVPTSDGSAERLQRALKQAGWQVAVDATSQNHWVDRQGRNFDDWWAARPGVLRSTVKRKAKKGAVALSITDQFSDSDWDDFEAVYRQSWKPAESHPDFLRARARMDAEQGSLRLGIARIDGEAVAAQYWVTAGGTAHIQKLSHVAAHDALSPGTLLTHALFHHAFDIDRVDRIDFGTGDDGYKRDWLEDAAPLVTISAWDAAQLGAWPSWARDRLSRVAARLRGR